MDLATREALAVAPEALGRGAALPLEVVADDEQLTRRVADDMWAAHQAARAAGRAKTVLIVPVGPVGQYELLAERANRTGTSLADLVLINMDEYLSADGKAFIEVADPLSFRRHMDERFYHRLDPALAPPVAQRVFPDPTDPANVARTIERFGGVDVCFGGVGITGHVAFNDPPQPGETIDGAAFADLPTRVVRLSVETRVINAVTAARGNIERIPELAITVGMREILASRRVRLYLNRPWQCAIVRKLLHGPVSHHVPASLLQRHPDCRVVITAEVAERPEPTLR